jgi:hypothetical protein
VNTPESLQQRLRHLADLGEALPEFAADPDRPTWLYDEICRECFTVWDTVLDYWTQTLAVKVAIATRNAMNAAPPYKGEHGKDDHH